MRDDDFLIELRPDLDDAVDRLLRRLERGEGSRVEPQISKLLAEHPDYHMTNYAMGAYYAFAAREPGAAIPFFERAIAIYPQFAEAHFNLGMAARQAMQLPKAVDALRAAERYGDEEAAAVARKELQWLETALIRETPFRSLDEYIANLRLFDSAFACLTRQEYQKSAELFQSVLSQNPLHVQSHGNLALAYAGLGRRADALASFDRALELDPEYAPAIQNRNVIFAMREGVPFIPENFHEVEFYADQVRAETNG